MGDTKDACMEPTLCVGVDGIDEDHARLFDLFEQLKEAGRGEEAALVGEVLNKLADSAENHFSREEELQKALRYKGLAPHMASHEEIRERLRAIRSDYDKDPASVDVKQLGGFLHCWLARHIMKEDAGYVPLVAETPEAVAFLEAMGSNEND